MNKVGRYEMVAEPFHSDFKHDLQMGHLGNYLLNAADFHSSDRGFGMRYLNTIQKTWVLSRLCIEMNEMPKQYSKFFVETWVENALRYFTNRNFRVEDAETGRALGYGRSVWALIDTQSRQPCDIFALEDRDLSVWIESEKECPIDKPGRAKISSTTPLVRSIDTNYCDVDVNGHINSVKYIEHILDLFSLDWYRTHRIKRFDIAYVAETYYGDKLNFYMETSHPAAQEGDDCVEEIAVRVTKTPKESLTSAAGSDSQSECSEKEVVRCLLKIVNEKC